MRPSLARTVRPKKVEGAGNAGRSLHPQPRVRNKTKHTSIVTTVTPESPGIPRAMVLTVSFVLSSVTMLFCHRRPADMVLSKSRLGRLASAKLDASLGASEPHDFAVRFSIFRPARRSIAHRPCPPALHHVACPTLPRPPHPVPNVRDDRETPLCGTGQCESVK